MFSGTQDTTGRTVKCNLSGCWESEAQKGRCVRMGKSCVEERLGHRKRRESVSYFRQISFPKQCPPNSAQRQPPTSAGEQSALGVAYG